MADVVIYTKAYCPYCVRAVGLLREKQVAYQEIRIDLHPERRDEMISRANGRTTVPQIFIDEQHIGGCDDMVALDNQGKLDSLLQA